jgi:hypothetical protein
MQVGMLWFDNDPQADIISKVQRAADYYRQKYGQSPNLCFIHPSMLPKKERMVAGSIVIKGTPQILPNHFWLGITRKSKELEEPVR